MRKLFLFLLLTLSVQLFGQRVNRNGEKMVSVVHVDKYTVNGKVDEHTDIYYTYNDFGELDKVTRVILNDGDEHKDILVRQSDGQFERCFYFNGKKSGIHKYEYETNEYGLIKTKIDKYKLNGDSIMKITGYEYINNGEWVTLVQVYRLQYVKDNNVWSNSSVVDYINFGYIDGNCYWDKMYSTTFNIYNKRKYFNKEMKYNRCRYSSIVNDTNINPNLFLFMGLCWEICLDVHDFEMSTEWCGLLTDHIIEYSDGFEIVTNKDNNGNLSEITAIGRNNKPYRRINLVYEY